MLRFLFKILRSAIISIVIMTGLFFLIMSFFSKKFPPDIELAKESIKNLLYAKENYSALVNKSGNYLNTELDENINIISAVPNTEHSENKQIDLHIKQIKSQLNRIEEQNNLILKKLRNNN